MLINHIERIEFDMDEVRRGTLIYAKHRTWKEGMSGIVYHVSEERITVMFPNEKTNTQNHFFILHAPIFGISCHAWHPLIRQAFSYFVINSTILSSCASWSSFRADFTVTVSS